MWNKKKIFIRNFIGILIGTVLTVIVIIGIQHGIKTIRDNRIISSHDAVNIVVLGDSIWDLVRDETGIAARLQTDLGGKATIYNLSIKGSSAAASGGTTGIGTQQDQICLYAMAKYLTGVTENDIPEEYTASDLLDTVDMNSVDYVLIAYGLNDYFGSVPLKNPDDYYDVTTYEGAMCESIEMLKEAYPSVQFVILSPTYCQGYSYGQVVHESNTYSYGGGTGLDYVTAAKEVADSYSATFVNNTTALPISIHNGPEYLVDGTHLTQKGRREYAANLASYILETYE